MNIIEMIKIYMQLSELGVQEYKTSLKFEYLQKPILNLYYIN